jgi:Na+-transporting NADH:ubiquinone oxidoreductase subunit C
MTQFTPAKTIRFAVLVCLVCAVLVSSAAVGLKDKQLQNEILDRQKKVLDVAGLLSEDILGDINAIQSKYDVRIKPQLVPLETDGCQGEDPQVI